MLYLQLFILLNVSHLFWKISSCLLLIYHISSIIIIAILIILIDYSLLKIIINSFVLPIKVRDTCSHVTEKLSIRDDKKRSSDEQTKCKVSPEVSANFIVTIAMVHFSNTVSFIHVKLVARLLKEVLLSGQDHILLFLTSRGSRNHSFKSHFIVIFFFVLNELNPIFFIIFLFVISWSSPYLLCFIFLCSLGFLFIYHSL